MLNINKEMLVNNQAVKIDYRKKRNNQPNEFEREELKARLYKFTKIISVAGVFKTSRFNVGMAFLGRNALLINKIKSYIEKYEARNGSA